ncbi:MAG TPA: SpoIIE family protein phosphatase [Acidobacteriaceae bacterium]
MLPRILRSLCTALVCVSAVGTFSSQAESASVPVQSASNPLVVRNLGLGAISLGGPWRFHLGDNPDWIDPSFDDSGWEQLDGSKPWGVQTHPNTTGFAWYRRNLDISQASGALPDLALLVPRIDDVYEIYWNGRLVAHHGKMPPHPSWFLTVPAQTIGLGRIGRGVLAVRVWKAIFSSRDSGLVGGFAAPLVLGSPQVIDAMKGKLDYVWLREQTIVIGLYSLYGLLGFLAFLFWLRDRTQWLLFWTAGLFIPIFLEVVFNNLALPWPANIAVGLTLPINAVENISLWYLTCWLLELRDDQKLMRLTRLAAITLMTANIADALLAIFLWPSPWEATSQITDGILTVVITVLVGWNIVPVAVALLRRSRVGRARWLFASTMVIAQSIYVVGLAADQGKRFTHSHLFETLHTPLFHVFGAPVMAYTIADSSLLLTLIYALIRYFQDVTRRRNTLEQEFLQARELQQVIIPEALPAIAGFTLTSAYKPALEVGGDFFQIIPLTDGSTLVVLGDVSGKGLRAAMAVSLIVGAVRMVAEFTMSPAEILAGVNRRLHGRLQGGFATALALRLCPDGNCTLATAGHPGPFIDDTELKSPGALPLGLDLACIYEETPFYLRVGDHLALYTDGLLEACSPTGEIYGFDRLKALFATKPNAREAMEAAVDFGQDDDITILTFTRSAVGEESTAVSSVPVPIAV